jgi:predicted nucleotidyltransferase
LSQLVEEISGRIATCPSHQAAKAELRRREIQLQSDLNDRAIIKQHELNLKVLRVQHELNKKLANKTNKTIIIAAVVGALFGAFASFLFSSTHVLDDKNKSNEILSVDNVHTKQQTKHQEEQLQSTTPSKN